MKKLFNRDESLKESSFLLFKAEGSVDNQVASAYRSAFKARTKSTSNHFSRECAIVCTQPLALAESVLGRDYLRVLNIVKEECEKLNCLVLLKPHPRESDLAQYKTDGFSLLNGSDSIEELFAESKNLPKCVFGFTSTALVTSSIFFGVPAISLDRLLDGKELDSESLDMQQRYEAKFSAYVEFPKNVRELRGVLARILI